MAARRLVLNGLTAEVAGGAGGGSAPASPGEFYHELELYRVLLALPEPRARTPDPPVRTRRVRRRARTPDARAPPPPLPPPQTRPARYLGSFGAGGAADARADVSRRLHCMKEGAGGCAVPVLLAISLAGVKVCDPHDQSVRMSHALRRISYATCERARALFAFVAREPRVEPRTEPRTEPLGEPEPSAEPNAEPNQQYCHAFETDTPEQAEELNALVGDAFRMAFASQLQPSAPLWSRELNGGGGAGGGGTCSRIPDSLPGLTAHYPHLIDRSPTRCDNLGGRRSDEGEEGEASEASPSSSEEWNSPTELSCYRRLGERGAERGERGAERGERPGVMRRLALGLSGALLQPSDDDSTPLVTDTPTTPTNAPLCLGVGGGGGGGYINEAAEEARRDRERRRRAAEHDFDFTHLVNGRGAGSSAAASTSSGSSCASGNNNTAPNAAAQRPPEPELTHAPWFQQGIPREIALEVLAAQAPGAFLVRASTTQAGCLALSLRVPRDFAPHGLAHYLILRTPKGYKIKGFTKEFRSLSALVTHHSVMPELLPVPLRLPRAPPRPRPDMEALERLAPPPATPPAAPAPPPAPPRLAYRAPLDV